MSHQLSNLCKTKTPSLLSSVKLSELSHIRGVCLDIDDTLSTEGKLEPEPYASLWRLKNAGFAVVPITGRPAGWCDHFARFWPVDAVVGENGAFTFFMQTEKTLSREQIPHPQKNMASAHQSTSQKVRKKLLTPAGAEEHTLKEKLTHLSHLIKEQFPESKWASDQPYREFDLAIDICEDVHPWERTRIEQLLSLCTKQGAHAKLSSIHVNTWFGSYDKKKGFAHWLNQGAPGCLLSPLPKLEEWLYIGDSPNDEPMFEWFPYSVGVANIGKYLDQLTHHPRWITRASSGAGFVEMTDLLIEARQLHATK